MSAKINTIIILFCWGKWKIAKIWFLFTSHLQIFFSKTTQQNFSILHTNSPWVCVIREIIVKNNLKKVNLLQTIENLLL